MFQKLVKGNFEFACGDLFGAGEIDHFTVRREKIEFPFPIISHGKDIDVVTADIIDFLIPVLFGDDEIDPFDRTDDFGSLVVGDEGFFPFDRVEFIGRDGDDQFISQRAETLEEVEMTDMEHIEGSVG